MHTIHSRLIGLLFLFGTIAACTTTQVEVNSGSAFITGPISTFYTDQGFMVVVARAEASNDQQPRAIVGLYTREGLTTEPIPGYAHMGEHLYANSKYPLPSPDMPAGSKALDSNAQARPDYVSMWITVNRPDDTDAAPIGLAARFASRAWWPEISDELIEQERRRVIAELTRDLRWGGFLTRRALEHAFYGARPEMPEEIALTQAYDADQIRTYLAHAYQPENLVLVVAGDIDPVQVEAELRAVFEERGPIPINALTEHTQLDARPEAFAPDPGPVFRNSRLVEGDWLGMGYPVVARSDRERAALLVVDQLLLAGRSEFEALWEISRSLESPLGEALSQTGPLTGLDDGRGYGAASPPLAERDPAFFSIIFSAEKMAFEDGQARLLDALAQVRRTTMTNDDAIRQSQRDLLAFYRAWLSTQNLRPLSDHLAGLAMVDPDRTQLILQLHREIADVTPRDVRRAFDRHFIESQMRWAYFDGVTPDSEAAEE